MIDTLERIETLLSELDIEISCNLQDISNEYSYYDENEKSEIIFNFINEYQRIKLETQEKLNKLKFLV